MIPSLLLAVAAEALCPRRSPAPGPGEPELVHVAAPAAMAANNEGKALYRQSRFEEARARYRAALDADPAFLAPRLNIACSFARQERFADAAAEAAALIRRAYVPWAREVGEAFDLAPLEGRREKDAIRTALAEAAPAWGGAAIPALLFVARTRPPVRLRGEGTLFLRPSQELFAWRPDAGRYRQLTAEDGRVLAFVRGDDGRRVWYVRGDKLLRAPGREPALRGLALRSLDLATMALGPAVDVPGDVTRLELAVAGAIAALRVTTAGGTTSLRFDGQSLSPAAAPGGGVVLTAHGVAPSHRSLRAGGCRLDARDTRARDLAGIEVRGRDGTLALPAPFGAGLSGLPIEEW